MVTAAMPITVGTKTPATLSAVLAMGAFVAAASLTMRMICESAVSSPTPVARQRRKPDWLIVPALTLSFSALSTGRLSPVSADSFTALVPERTMPSTGMLSPGRTRKMSPRTTSSAGTMTSSPFRSSRAVFGESCMSERSASVVLPLECASSVLPTVMSVNIIAADSK